MRKVIALAALAALSACAHITPERIDLAAAIAREIAAGGAQ